MDEAVIERETAAFIAANTRRCSALQVGGFRPSGNPLATRFGGTPMGLPGEQWPSYVQPGYQGMIGKEGDLKQCAFVCQLSLGEAPFVPEILADVAFITVFCGHHPPDRHGQGGGPLAFSETVTIKSYPTLDGLVAMNAPADAPSGWLLPFEARFEECIDHPNYDDRAFVLPERLSLEDDEADDFTEMLENRYCSKIGGYFSSIQHEAAWHFGEKGVDYQFAFQIAEEEKTGLFWIDGGILGVGTGLKPDGERVWAADIQFY